jgi:hypothetical protein
MPGYEIDLNDDEERALDAAWEKLDAREGGPAVERYAAHDVSDEPRDDSGKWTKGGGGGAKGAVESPGNQTFYHVTKKGVGDAIRKGGFRAGTSAGLEMGPGVYLAATPRYPTRLRKAGEEYDTEVVQTKIDPSVKFFPLDPEAPNPVSHIYRNLFGDDWAKKYDADSKAGRLFSGMYPNWAHLHELLKAEGYGGISRPASADAPGNTDMVVFDPKNVRVQPVAYRGREQP